MEFTAYAAEDALEKILDSFNYNINNRITIIVYNSQNDFQETNVTDSYLSEGIQGFTELFKNRVVVQCTGSYKALRHLIHHELSHAVINDMFYGGSLQNIISNNITLQLPLWFNEGLAEYQALGWNIEEDMFIRDAAIGEYLPDVQQLFGFFAYRGGQAVFFYIAKKYGKEKIGELIHKLKGVGNINEAFKQTLGLSIKEFNERWKKDIKRTYWPDIEVMFDPDEYAKRLTDPEEDDGFYNTGPALSPKGDKVAFITNRDFFFSLYLMDAHTGEIIKELAEGNIAPDFEELNIIAPGLTWSPDGKTLAISALSHGYDLIYLLDVDEKNGQLSLVKKEKKAALFKELAQSIMQAAEEINVIQSSYPKEDYLELSESFKRQLIVFKSHYLELQGSLSPSDKKIIDETWQRFQV